MSSSTQDLAREQATLNARVAHYVSRGYKVVKYPSPDELPCPLDGYSIEFKAAGHSRIVAGIVRSYKDLAKNGDKNLAKIVAAVAQLPGWELDVVSMGCCQDED